MRRPNYQASPQPVVISSLNGAIPTIWDANWQLYTDLTQEQIAAFQAMPEWQSFVANHAAWVQSPIGNAPSLTVATVQQLQSVNIGAVTLK